MNSWVWVVSSTNPLSEARNLCLEFDLLNSANYGKGCWLLTVKWQWEHSCWSGVSGGDWIAAKYVDSARQNYYHHHHCHHRHHNHHKSGKIKLQQEMLPPPKVQSVCLYQEGIFCSKWWDLISAKYVAWHGGDFTKESVKATTKTMKNKPSVKMWDYVQCTVVLHCLKLNWLWRSKLHHVYNCSPLLDINAKHTLWCKIATNWNLFTPNQTRQGWT